MSKQIAYTLRAKAQEYTLFLTSKFSLSGACFLCRGEEKRTKAKFTFKCVAKVEDKHANAVNKEILAAEGNLLQALDHPSIAKCLEIGTGVVDSAQGLVFVNFLKLESLPTRSLVNILEEGNSRTASSLSLKSKKDLFHKLSQSISYLHSKGIVNHNLKLSNIMVSDDSTSIKLYDFSRATNVAEGSKAIMDKAEDVLSLGYILFGLHTGRAPFDQTEQSEWKKLFYSPFRLCYWQGVAKQSPNISIHFINIINGMLEADPIRRISISGVEKNGYFSA